MKTKIVACALALVSLLSSGGNAQPTVTDAPASGSSSSAPLAPGASTPIASSTTTSQVTTTTTTSTPGLYFPMGSEAAKNNAASLPSSSRPLSDIGASRDGFDLNQNSHATVVRGSKGSVAITGESARAVVVPDVHTVRAGDTMWDLCGHYLGNPWDWPRIWSYNPDVQNPNWIYPGDQLRFRSPDESGRAPVAQSGSPDNQSGMLGSGPSSGEGQLGSPLGSTARVGKDTVFLRNEAYIDDPDKDVWGQVVGANEEQMLLGQGNHVYLDLKPSVELKVGQQLTLFERSRKPDAVEGARQPPGEIRSHQRHASRQ
ncbi:MAG: LysM peptidoglycan-binding domain-containing protein [Polyangiaceae bacterium]